jgi:hypothetical protein
MTSPKPPRLGLRDYLALLAMYAIGLAPGVILDAYTPAGEHLGWIPLLLGALVGWPWGLTLAGLLRLFVNKPARRELYATMLIIYSIAWTGPAIIRYANKALDDGPRIARTLTVQDLVRPTKGPTRITIKHWDAGAPPFTINGFEQPGASLNVYTHSGFLGFAWIELPDDDEQNRRRGMIR